MKIAADYKRITRQRGSLRVTVLSLAALAALTAGVLFRLQQSPSLTTVTGDTVSWQHKQWTVLNYFAEWCQPCLRELPELNQFHDQGEARVIGVSFDELTSVQLLEVAERQQIRFPLLSSESAAALPVDSPIVLPTTYIISPSGEVRKTIRGEVTVKKLQAAIAQSQ